MKIRNICAIVLSVSLIFLCFDVSSYASDDIWETVVSKDVFHVHDDKCYNTGIHIHVGSKTEFGGCFQGEKIEHTTCDGKLSGYIIGETWHYTCNKDSSHKVTSDVELTGDDLICKEPVTWYEYGLSCDKTSETYLACGVNTNQPVATVVLDRQINKSRKEYCLTAYVTASVTMKDVDFEWSTGRVDNSTTRSSIYLDGNGTYTCKFTFQDPLKKRITRTETLTCEINDYWEWVDTTPPKVTYFKMDYARKLDCNILMTVSDDESGVAGYMIEKK